jgi:hypothetical protein
VRNRGALRGTRSVGRWAARVGRTAATLLVVPATMLLLSAQGANAAETTDVEARVPFSIAGPVGLAAVALGLGGFVLGLVRLRRRTLARPVEAAVEQTAPHTPVA